MHLGTRAGEVQAGLGISCVQRLWSGPPPLPASALAFHSSADSHGSTGFPGTATRATRSGLGFAVHSFIHSQPKQPPHPVVQMRKVGLSEAGQERTKQDPTPGLILKSASFSDQSPGLTTAPQHSPAEKTGSAGKSGDKWAPWAHLAGSYGVTLHHCPLPPVALTPVLLSPAG